MYDNWISNLLGAMNHPKKRIVGFYQNIYCREEQKTKNHLKWPPFNT